MSTSEQETRIAEIRQEIADLEAVFDALAEWTAANITQRDALNVELDALLTPPPPPIPETPAEFYGPVGEWPEELDWAHGDNVSVVRVHPSWAEIAKVAAANPDIPLILAVVPGKLTGNGAGSTKTPVLQGIHRTVAAPLLIMAAEGFGTVTTTNSWRIHDLWNVSFAHFDLWPFGYVATNCKALTFARSTVKPANISTTTVSSGITMHELVRLEPVNEDSDAWAIRNSDKAPNAITEDVTVRGCLALGAYKAATSIAHCDTIQISGPGKFRRLAFVRSLIPASSNHGLILTPATDDVLIDRSAIIGGGARIRRFPDAADRYQGGGGIPINGAATNVRAVDSIITGAIKSAVTITGGSADAVLTPAWWAEHAPIPTRAELAKLWELNSPL